MALQDQKITSSDLANKGVVGLPDTPNLSTLVMQQKFDEIATAVIVPKFNALIDYLIESLAPIVSDNPQDGEVLIYFADSSQYKNGVYRTTLSALKDVNVGGVQNKMFLCYDADRDLWYPEASSGVMETISACKDVSIVNPQTGDIFKFDGTAWANVPDERGLLIVFNIDSEDGATITALTPSGDTVTATSLGGGQYVIKSDEYGEWHLTGEKNGETVETTIDVKVSQIYDVTMTFFAATITVTYPADATVTCSKGSEEYTATGSPYTFTVHGSGDWVIEGTRSGITETQTVTITTNGQSESVTLTILPDGSTITPTDSIPTLLHCADIWNKSYTSIGEVLADDDSLFKILTTDNSIDYLVRSTTYASSVTADSDAMAMIGSYDYCADSLLADSTWASAIDASTYRTSVINYENPTMTSATTPSGECISSSDYSGQTKYQAFDKNVSTAWSANTALFNNTEYIGYVLSKTVKLCGASYKARLHGTFNQTVNVKYQASDNGTDWTDAVDSFVLQTFSTSANTETNKLFTAPITKSYIRLLFGTVVSSTGGTPNPTAVDLRFYGRENGGVQSWLKAGGITDKTYTTLAEVLADTTTLSTLIASHDAVDYLVTAKGLIDGIVADATAMSYIGLNNYCANTLLADAEWCEAIANSTYKESVLNVKVPTMTSSTTPSGEVVESGHYSTNAGWYAFDNNGNNFWSGAEYVENSWVGYHFTSNAKIYVCILSKYRRPTSVKVDSSSDGTNWNAISESTATGVTSDTVVSTPIIIICSPSTAQGYVRLYCVSTYNHYEPNIYTVQFYGREDV